MRIVLEIGEIVLDGLPPGADPRRVVAAFERELRSMLAAGPQRAGTPETRHSQAAWAPQAGVEAIGHGLARQVAAQLPPLTHASAPPRRTAP